MRGLSLALLRTKYIMWFLTSQILPHHTWPKFSSHLLSSSPIWAAGTLRWGSTILLSTYNTSRKTRFTLAERSVKTTSWFLAQLRYLALIQDTHDRQSRNPSLIANCDSRRAPVSWHDAEHDWCQSKLHQCCVITQLFTYSEHCSVD